MTTIEDLEPEYFVLVAGWLSRPEIKEWRGRSVTREIIAIMARNNKRNRLFLVRCDGQPVGLTALADIETADAVAMIWYLLGEASFSGRGIICDAVRQTTQHCFRALNLKSVYGWVMADNQASIKVLKRAGFNEAGRIRQAAVSNGRQVDRVYFDLLPRDVPNAVR
jgi:[ribosomal protein S5]-alanine N-acetyltransferase